MKTANLKGKSGANPGVGGSDLKLSSKPFWFLIIIWADGRESVNSTFPHNHSQ